MSTLARPWRRWAVAAPAGSFVIAAFVLAPGGVPAIGIPAALEVGVGGVASSSPSVAHTDPTAGVVPRGTSNPTGRTTAQNPGTLPHTGTGSGSHPRTVASASDGVTVVSAQQPVVVTTGGEPGDDDSQRPTSSPTPSPSPTGSWGGGPGDE